MMDTVLNLGLNDETVEGWPRRSGDERFAYDSYRRFIQMYSDVVLGVDHHEFEEASRIQGRQRLRLDTELTADDWRGAGRALQGARRGDDRPPFPQDPHEQLWGAIGAVFGSWMNARAITYRRSTTFPTSWGTAVNVQAMVFGNMGETSATGVAFTRNPSTGEKALYGEFLVNAQGEDVVAGIRTPQPSPRPRARSGGAPTSRRWKRRCRRPTPSSAHLRPLERTTATCRTSSSPSSAASCGCCRPATASAPPRPRSRSPSTWRRGLIDEERRCCAHRSDGARPAAAPDARSRSRARRARHRPARLARRASARSCSTPTRPSGWARGEQGHPGAGRDQPRGHPRHARRRGHPHHARRHDQPRGGGRARHGQALRLGRRRDARSTMQAQADASAA
jgi:hypothetical protein